MALTRAQALTSLATRFDRLYRAAGLTVNDADDGLGPVVDLAWRFFGNDPANLTSTILDETAGRIVLDAIAYHYVMPRLATLIDTSQDAPAIRVAGQQIYDHAKELAKDAYAAAAQYGWSPKPQVAFAEVDVSDRLQRYRDINAPTPPPRRGQVWGEFG